MVTIENIFTTLSLAGFLTFYSCAGDSSKTETIPERMKPGISSLPLEPAATDTATFANGCFWCTEAIFEQLNGVFSATSGYSGGQTVNPTYEEVSSGETGHAECLQIIFDPFVISYTELLEVFWQTHDPTTLNRQGADIGTQYRSAIFFHNKEQQELAEKFKEALNKSGAYNRPVVTEITAFRTFFPAEAYHQQYYENNKNKNSYCRIVIQPKLEKFRAVFRNKLKQ